MTGSTLSPATLEAGPEPAVATAPARAAAGRRSRRFAVMAGFVGLWMALGWALHLGAVAYLLAGIPLTIAFQVLVARRPIRSLWIVVAPPFRLDRPAVVIALGLAALPLYVTITGLVGGRLLDVGYGLTGVIGAAPAAFAIRRMDTVARRALVRSLLTAGVVAALLFLVNRLFLEGSAMTDPLAAAGAFALSLLLYVPMVFVIEEVFFRGALDPYGRGPGRANDLVSAIVVSLLWGAWHLPLLSADTILTRLPITMAYHLVVGLLLTGPWRRSGNLVVPGITHALIDAIRDGLAAA